MSAKAKTALRAPSKRHRRARPHKSVSATFGAVVLLMAITATFAFLILRNWYTFSLQSPVQIHLRWPLVVAAKIAGEDAADASADQFGRRLTAYQQYACNKFGSACRESTGCVRDLPLQFRRNAGLGLFPDQYRAPHTRRAESARSVGLPGQYRFCLPALPGARFPAVEHLQQRSLSQVSPDSVTRLPV